ncbi:MAG: gluconate transporter [Flavobacteriaceae bacterium]|nr:gluconate transporter [Flavobacteriaceae bacterium]|tara:strand:+ start:30704 stop:32020 length:1317 start_codon:yes stop_codon:yes gene_type:complete
MPLLVVLLSISFLFVLISLVRLNAFISFIIICLFVGLFQGMILNDIILSIQKGIGDTLGFLVMILGFGAMLGKLVADSGAAQKITTKLVSSFGLKYVQFALVLAGFIVGIPMFYSVGFVILVPLVFTIATSTGLPLIYVGLPMLASLSVTHGFLPPHPAPTTIASMFNADIGKTLLYGVIIAIPTIIIAGPLFSRSIKHIKASPLKEFYNPVVMSDEEIPSMTVSTLTALFPVILIMISSFVENFISESFIFKEVIIFIGNPVIAMLISVLLAIYTLGIARGVKIDNIMHSISESISSITMVLLIIAGAGALKQILIDSGVSDYIGLLLKESNLPPLILAWLIATIMRVCVGSATVAGLTAAGIVLPLVGMTNVSPELMVLAIGSGSLMLSHVNDAGFWMFKEYFNLSLKDTLSTWTVMEGIVGLMGLIGVLILNIFV